MHTNVGGAYRVGQAVTARVDQVFHFGVFVRLPDDTRAYVRKRELTREGDLNPYETLSTGDEIEAVVIALPEKGHHLELSVRRAKPDLWDEFVRAHKVQDTVVAAVKKLLARGVLAQIIPGVDGYIPLPELAPWQVDKPGDLVWVGDLVKAMITHLDRKSKRVTLSIRRQMKHQTNVSQVVEFLRRKGQDQDIPVDEVDLVCADEKIQDLDPLIIGRVGQVLIVDDHDEVREPLVKWLERLGLAVQGVRSGEAALESLQESTFGLALIDLDPSDQDGLEFIRSLQVCAPHTRMAVISVPEWIAGRGQELAALQIADVLVKPLHLDEVLDLLIRIEEQEPLDPLCWQAPERRIEPPADPFQLLSETMRGGLPLARRLEAGLQEFVHTTRADKGIIFYLDPDSHQLSIVAEAGRATLSWAAVDLLSESPVKDVIHERDVAFEENVSFESRERFAKLLELLPFESCVGVPISAGERVQHALWIFHQDPNAFSRYRLRDAWAMAALLGAAIEHGILEQRIRSISPILLSGQLAAGFGHEVYNKMSGLEIQLRNLQADCERLSQETGQGQPGQPLDLTRCCRAVDRLLHVALDLKGTVELFRELVRAHPEERMNVNQVVGRTVELLRPTAHRHGVALHTDLLPDLPPIAGSAIRLQQVFANLILNAIQHTADKMSSWPDSRGQVQITTTWESDRERPVCIRFIDNGPGIHRHLWKSIFGLGFSTRPNGTGLGLYIAQILAESMDGRVVVQESMVPMGTTFRVELPGA